MASPITLQDQFVRMERDFPRTALRKGSVWNMTDLIPNLGAPLRGRGGWQNASNDIASTVATATYVIAGIYANYTAGDKNICIDEDGNLVTFIADGTVTNVGAALIPVQNPVIHRDIVVVTATGGGTAPKKVTNSGGTLTIGSLGGSPPNGIYAAVFKDRTILANSSANNNRMWFSDPGDPEGWDVTNAYWDFSYPITGLWSLRTAILVFHDSYVSRLRGSTPPPGDDFISDDPLFNVGCTDARSIVGVGDRVVFANPEGIFITDGSAQPASLTKLTGMQTYWRDQMVAYAKSTWTLIGGHHQGHYVISVMDGSTFKFAAMIDLDRLNWLGLTNVDARSMWTAEATADELYFGRRGAARVGKFSTVFSPQSAYKNDGDGDAVAPVLETGFYEGDPGKKRIKNVTVGADVTDFASDNPAVTVSYLTDPAATSYTALSTTIAEGTDRTYSRLPINKGVDGIAFKLAKANAGDFRVYSLEAEIEAESRDKRA